MKQGTPHKSREHLSLLVCAVFGAVLVLLHISAFRPMSPVDEIQHLDYVLRVRSGDLVHRGDLLLPETRRIAACRGFDAQLSGMLSEDWERPRCEAEELRPDQFPQLGFNTAWRHPPTYYVITAGMASAIDLVPGVGDMLSAARIAGVAWALATIWLLWLLSRAFEVPVSNRVLLILFLIASPGVLFYLSVVTEDGTAVGAGAALLLSARLWQQGRAQVWLPVIVAFGAGALKWTNLAGVAAAALFLILSEVLGRRERIREAGKVAVAMLAACLFVVGLWFVAQSTLAKVSSESIPLIQQQQVETLPLGRTVAQTRQMVTPLRIEYLPDALEHDAVYLLVLVADAGLIAILLFRSLIPSKPPSTKQDTAPVSKKVRARREAGRTDPIQPLAIAVGSVMLVSGVAFVLAGFVAFGVFNQVQPRFGLSLLPGAFIVVGNILRSPGGRIALGTIAISTIGVVTLSLLAA